MKKTIITATVAICTTLGAFAQSSTMQSQAAPATNMQQMQRNMPSPEDRAKRMTEQINTAVKLSPEQYQKVLQVNKDYMTKMDAFRTANQGQAQQAGASASNRGAEFKKMNDEKDTQLKTILTPEQFQKWQDSRKMMPHQGPGGMQPAGTVPAQK